MPHRVYFASDTPHAKCNEMERKLFPERRDATLTPSLAAAAGLTF